MIRRGTWIQLGVFLVLSVVGVVFVLSDYVGVHPFSPPYTIHAMFAGNSGGIFTNAEVTERGVTVGKVSGMHITPQGVKVDLQINHGVKIPATGTTATVADLSAVGEQYVDLEPTASGGPWFRPNDTIPATQTSIPVDDTTILTNLNALLTSVNDPELATTINELGKGFADLGPTLQSLIDNGNALTKAAIANLPAQLQLINDGKTVLDTQNELAGELKSWAASFASFSDEVRITDPALRGVLDNGVKASQQLQTLLADNAPALPPLLDNLTTFNRIQELRLPQVRSVLELFPSTASAGFEVTPGDGTAHFGQVQDTSNPCTTGYSSTKIRGNDESGTTLSQDYGGPANLNAYCQAPSTTIDVRGSRNVPRPPGDNANITNSSPYPGPVYGKSSYPTYAQQEENGASPAGGSSATASSAGTSAQVASYDPMTQLFTLANGQSYILGLDAPPAVTVPGLPSWAWLLVSPTMR